MMYDSMSSYDLSDQKERGDFLDHLRKVQAKDPGRLSDAELASALMNNLYVPLSMRETPADYLKVRRQRHDGHISHGCVLLPRQKSKDLQKVDRRDRSGRSKRRVVRVCAIPAGLKFEIPVSLPDLIILRFMNTNTTQPSRD